MPRLLQLNLLVLLWSLTGILGKIISLQPVALVFWRTAIALILFFVFCHLSPRDLLRIARKPLLHSLFTGFILGLHWLCFFGAIAVSNISVGIAGFAATSLFTALLEPLLEKRPPDSRKIGLAVLVAVGVTLIASAKTEVPNPLLGLSLALIGALLASIYSLCSKRLVSAAIPGPSIMLYQILAANLAAVFAIALFPFIPFEIPQLSDWPALLILSAACTFGAYLWCIHLLKNVTAYTLNLTVNFEPVYGILMAAALFAEYKSLTPLFYLGTLTIVAANALNARQPE